VRIVPDLLTACDEQAAAISKIDKNVQRLIDGPWNTARLYLKEASLPGQTDKSVHDRLLKAAEQLRSAIPLQEDRTLAQAYVCVDLAVVLRLLGDSKTSVFYARMAIEAAKGFVVRMETEKLRPPGFSPAKHRASQVFFNLTTSTYGRDGRKDWRDVSIDDSMNWWYRSIYAELGPIVTAVTALCGEKDPVAPEAKSTIPNLRCQSGQIRNLGLWHNQS
jgi:hypothetical protein